MCRNVRERDATKFHVQLSIAIFCMLLVFVTGIERTEVKAGCVTVSVLLHYFTLASVVWMGAEAWLMFQKVAIVFVQISSRYILILSTICWGRLIIATLVIDKYCFNTAWSCTSFCIVIPLPFVIIPLAISRDLIISENL